ncbi:hypothetical protein CRG98_025889 [Punica granatum]|uniref:Stress-response A/B barrel domain-containing protein n=1 Tax=Punica granatum TaxID=22663 RepID=A0A2I0JBN2_PUNGR|nr:hypothetical protein CRG98_025889 [Punica granatum]
MEKLVSEIDFVKSFEWEQDTESQDILRHGFTHVFLMTFKEKEDFSAFLSHPIMSEEHIYGATSFSNRGPSHGGSRRHPRLCWHSSGRCQLWPRKSELALHWVRKASWALPTFSTLLAQALMVHGHLLLSLATRQEYHNRHCCWYGPLQGPCVLSHLPWHYFCGVGLSEPRITLLGFRRLLLTVLEHATSTRLVTSASFFDAAGAVQRYPWLHNRHKPV